MAVDHDRIARLLGEEETPRDHSLRAKSLDRALQQKVPATLTPYEWEQWYAENGIPDAHRNASVADTPWWRKLLRLKHDT